MDNKTNKILLTCSIILVSMRFFCLVCLCFSRRGISVLVMALYAHARTEEDAILFLQTNGLLTRVAPNCPTCNRTTTLIKKVRTVTTGTGVAQPIKASKIPYEEDLFSIVSLPLRNIVELLLFWAFQEPVLNTTGLTGVSENTVIQW